MPKTTSRLHKHRPSFVQTARGLSAGALTTASPFATPFTEPLGRGFETPVSSLCNTGGGMAVVGAVVCTVSLPLYSFGLWTFPSSKIHGPFGISPMILRASSSKIGSSKNSQSSSPPYALGRLEGEMIAAISLPEVLSGLVRLPRTWILLRVFSSNHP